jgi:hypothetical protein
MMSEPATQTAPATSLVKRTGELDRLARLGQWLAALESGQNDTHAKGAAAALRFYYAEQLDLPPTAVSELSVINGRLHVGAQLLRALAERRGYRVLRSDDSNDESCTAILQTRDGSTVLGRTTITLEQARKAGWVKPRSGWESVPGRMLWARASSWAIRDYAPEVSLGMYEIGEAVDGELVAEEDLGPVRADPGAETAAETAATAQEAPEGPAATAGPPAAAVPSDDFSDDLTGTDIFGAPAGMPPQVQPSDEQRRLMMALLGEAADGRLVAAGRDTILTYVSSAIGRPVGSRNELTARETSMVIDDLQRVAALDDESERSRRLGIEPDTLGDAFDTTHLPPPADETLGVI